MPVLQTSGCVKGPLPARPAARTLRFRVKFGAGPPSAVNGGGRSALGSGEPPSQFGVVGGDDTARRLGYQSQTEPGADALAAWAERTGRRRAGVAARGGLRFALYGRVSTEDWQDPVTSRARRREQAGVLVAGHGTIVAEFFDSGASRTLPWTRRPQAAALVAALADPDRGWDAVVIGEYERAFYGSQYAAMAPLFEHYGVTLWAPEVGGRIDYHAEDHEQTMLALGLSSKREITRTRIGSAPRWPRRPGNRAGTSAAARRTGTGWAMRGRIRTRRTRRGAGARTGWNRTRTRRRWSGGCSPGGWPGTARRGSPGR